MPLVVMMRMNEALASLLARAAFMQHVNPLRVNQPRHDQHDHCSTSELLAGAVIPYYEDGVLAL